MKRVSERRNVDWRFHASPDNTNIKIFGLINL